MENSRGEGSSSRLWYLLPFFLSIIGGLIAYFALRGKDPLRARRCLYLALILFGLRIALVGSFFFIDAMNPAPVVIECRNDLECYEIYSTDPDYPDDVLMCLDGTCYAVDPESLDLG